jgi:DmsE family decaheme c-type cytochrome
MTARHLAAVLVAVACAGIASAQDQAIGMSDCTMARVSAEVLERSCESCHGSAAAHVDDPSPDNISRTPGPAACTSCHPDSKAKAEILLPRHNRSGVTCLDCHVSGHDKEANLEHGLSGPSVELCGSCHQGERASFAMPYAHRDGQLTFDCSRCHSVHADTRPGRLSILGNGGACVDCHIEKAGPFIFPHPPSQTDTCVTCHLPHGTTNPKLLTRPSITMLCLECHANVPAFHDVSQARYQNCISCHAAIHGSNRDRRLIEE